MVLCPIAVAVGCRKCPAFAVCPLKAVIGDYKPDVAAPDKSAASSARPVAKRKAPVNRKGARARRPRK